MFAAGGTLLGCGGTLDGGGVDPAKARILRRIDTGEERLLFDEAAARIVDRQSRIRGDHAAVPIRHFALDPKAFGTAQPAVRQSSVEHISLGVSKFHYLQYGKQAGLDFSLNRVEDDNGSELVAIFAPNLPAGFLSASANAMRQQNVFYCAKRARNHLRALDWALHAPQRRDQLDLCMDETDACPAAPACFKEFYIVGDPGLYFDKGEGAAGDPMGIVHEFGQYIEYTYGGADYDCVKLLDQSGPLSEASAYVWSRLVPHRRYPAAILGNAFDGNANWGKAGGYPHKVSQPVCGVNADVCKYGLVFEEAVWEALFGLDCKARGVAACKKIAAADIVDPVGDFGWTSRGEARASLMRARLRL